MWYSMLIYKTASEIVSLLRRGDISQEEIIKASICRIDEVDKKINALPVKFFETALEKLKTFNRKSQLDNPKSLLGIPIAVKDYNDVKNVPTTFGSNLFKKNIPVNSDTTVSRLEANGAIPLAKSNVPEWAGGHTYNPVYGLTRNPWSLDKSAGGSSGGSAAAVATGQVWLATGNDLGGSLRTPAAFNGVVGLRPSPGVIPRGKSYPSYDTLWVEGPIARNVEDVSLMLDASSGYDISDPLSFNHPCQSFFSAIKKEFKPHRIAFSDDLKVVPIEPEIKIICQNAIKKISGVGIEITEDIPDFTGVKEAFHTLRATLMATMMGDLIVAHKNEIPEHIVTNVQQGFKVTTEEVIAAEKVRWHLYQKMNSFFLHHDFLLCPATSVTPFLCEKPFVEEINGIPCKTYFDWFAITFVLTMTSCPVLTLPCGLTESNLPVGIQIVGKPRQEEKLLIFGKFLEETFNLKNSIPIDPRDI